MVRLVPYGTVQATVPAPVSITALLPETLVPKFRMSLAVESVVKLCAGVAQTVLGADVERIGDSSAVETVCIDDVGGGGVGHHS